MNKEKIEQAANFYSQSYKNMPQFGPIKTAFMVGAKLGASELPDITHRNYLATVRHGLITEDTLLWDFIAKLKKEVKEFDKSFPEDWSELADIALVCFAMAEHYGIDLVDEMRKKTEFNEQRP